MYQRLAVSTNGLLLQCPLWSLAQGVAFIPCNDLSVCPNPRVHSSLGCKYQKAFSEEEAGSRRGSDGETRPTHEGQLGDRRVQGTGASQDRGQSDDSQCPGRGGTSILSLNTVPITSSVLPLLCSWPHHGIQSLMAVSWDESNLQTLCHFPIHVTLRTADKGHFCLHFCLTEDEMVGWHH